MDQNETIFVRVKYLDDFKFVTLPLSDLKPLTFCHRGKFNMNMEKIVNIKLRAINSVSNFQLPVHLNLF